MKDFGCMQVYCGNGKGKTTAAVGAAVRAAGIGAKVAFVQFLKDGDSSELNILRSLPQVTVLSGKEVPGFSNSFTHAQREIVKKTDNDYFDRAVRLCKENKCDFLVLDEILDAIAENLIDRAAVVEFIKNRPAAVEIVLTGRNPDEEICKAADYISDVQCKKHPYQTGVRARRGIEM